MYRAIRILAVVAALVVALGACSSDDGGSDPADTTDGGPERDTRTSDATTRDATDANDASDAIDATAPADMDATPVPDADGGGEDEIQCTMDQQCPGNAVCEEGQCRIYSVVQIRDLSASRSPSFEDACQVDASGSDLFQLELQGPFGKALGYAKAVKANLKSSANTNASGVFDGSSNSLKQSGDALCPSGGFASDSVLSLGCGGTLLVAFTDSGDNLLYLGDGQQLAVHEYGNQCCEGGCTEEYWEVRVCTAQSPQAFQDAMPDANGIYPNCSTDVLAIGSGHDTATLELPRP